MRPTFFVRLTAISLACVVTLTGCATGPSYVPFTDDVPPVEGPPVTDVVTPFDRAISCLDGQIHQGLTFSVGAILDATGKEQLSEGGTGKFITQGAGDIVQSALFQAGTTVLNRRDPRVMETEARWGVRDTKGVLPSVFFITGSINSLDFIPGGGFEAQIAGVGPRYRQYRIVVGLDLSLTETRTGRIVANVPLQKQIVASEAGFGVGRFFGDTLVSLDMGTQRREAVSFALRQMLNLATYELLTQLMKPELYSACSSLIDGVHGVVNSGRASRKRVITIPAPGELLPGAKPVASKPPAAEPTVPANGTPAVAMAAASGVDSLRPAASEAAAPSRAAQLQVVGGVAMEPAGQGSDAFVAVLPKPALNTPPAVDPQPQAIGGLASVVMPEAPAKPEPEAKPTAVAPEPKEVPESKKPPVSEVKVEPTVIATEPVVEAPPAVVEAPPAAPAPVVADKEKAVDATCRYPSGPYVTVRPAKGFKPGDMVYVESDTASSLCIVDANGKFTQHRFKPGKGRAFNGTPPWRLESPDLLSMRIFFQGVNLARIMPKSTSIVLQEAAAPSER